VVRNPPDALSLSWRLANCAFLLGFHVDPCEDDMVWTLFCSENDFLNYATLYFALLCSVMHYVLPIWLPSLIEVPNGMNESDKVHEVSVSKRKRAVGHCPRIW
jgi:hypothetical protein